jgi:hypothetical protein
MFEILSISHLPLAWPGPSLVLLHGIPSPGHGGPTPERYKRWQIGAQRDARLLPSVGRLTHAPITDGVDTGLAVRPGTAFVGFMFVSGCATAEVTLVRGHAAWCAAGKAHLHDDAHIWNSAGLTRQQKERR